MGQDEVQNALQVLQEHSTQRGDSFDIGNGNSQNTQMAVPSQPNELFKNPLDLINSMDVTKEQAENIRSLVVGGGTGAVHKMLNRHLGDQPAAVIGALLSGWAAHKFLK